jgi:hypothetical protein
MSFPLETDPKKFKKNRSFTWPGKIRTANVNVNNINFVGIFFNCKLKFWHA